MNAEQVAPNRKEMMMGRIGKSVRPLLLAITVALSIAAFVAVFSTPKRAYAETDDYSFIAENITATPTDDFLRSTTAGNQEHTNVRYIDDYGGELEISNGDAGGGNLNDAGGTAYLGGIILVNPGVTDYTDFTFTLKFRASRYADAARWLGIMYRMQTDENGLHGGYQFTARMNGASAYTSNQGVRSIKNTNSDNGYNDIDRKSVV